MKAISLWQPWATLIAIGAKRIETRSWPAPASLAGHRIAIHAAQTQQEFEVAFQQPFRRYIDEPHTMPLGAIVATAVLDRCPAMTAEAIAVLERTQPDEHAFGLYEVGRFAWVLHDVERLTEPVPFRGRQRIFDVPDLLLGPVPATAPEPPQGALL